MFNHDEFDKRFDQDWDKAEKRFARFFTIGFAVWGVLAIAWFIFIIWALIQLLQILDKAVG